MSFQHPQALPSQPPAAASNGGLCIRQVLPAHGDLNAEAPYKFRYISPTGPVVVFQGLDPTECEEFVYAIRNWGFLEGKYHDDAWIADLASSRMIGSALRWVIALPDATVKSWILFQKALLKKWPALEHGVKDQSTKDEPTAVVADKTWESGEEFGFD